MQIDGIAALATHFATLDIHPVGDQLVEDVAQNAEAVLAVQA